MTTTESPRVALWGGPYDGSEIKPVQLGPHVMKVPTGRRVHRYLVISVCMCNQEGESYMGLMGLHESLRRVLGIDVSEIIRSIDEA
jgi:hypothetical protein